MLHRRGFIGAGLAGATALTLSSVWSQSTPNFGPPTLPATGFRRMKLGDFEIIALNDGAFRRTIEDGINSGRDTDSIGVMAGAILGALHGESVISEDDRLLLDAANRFDLTAAADRFAAVAAAIMRHDQDLLEARTRHRQALARTP